MRQTLLFTLVIIIALALASCTSPQPARPAERAVRVDVDACGAASGTTGSGVALGDGRVLTVAHTLARGSDPRVTDASGRTHDAALVAIDLVNDLALLDAPDLHIDMPPVFALATVDTTGLIYGAAASGTVGYHVTRVVNLTTEHVLGSDQARRMGYELDADTERGDSGAGVYNEADRLVGIVFAVSTDQSSTWATASSVVEQFLVRAGRGSWQCDPAQSRVVDGRSA